MAKLNDTFCPGDQIRVGSNSRAAVIMANETLLRLDQNSAIKLTAIKPNEPSLIELLKGIGHFISRVPRSLKVETPTLNAAIEGTEFVVVVGTNETRITVFEGTVLASNKAGRVRLTSGESAVAKQGTAPGKQILAKPRDAVQWALYYPPILDPSLKPDDPVYRAAALLNAGRVDEAGNILGKHPDNGHAQALQAIIAIMQNRNQQAMQLAQRAIQLAPESAAPYIALSYAQQAGFDLDAALASARRATDKQPGNALAWARVAELQLSLGKLDDALQSAQKASGLDDRLSRTQTVLGFAHLVQIDTDAAMQAFQQAIELDQTDPLPRLGQGLAKIRRNDLAEGRREIEIAASLDPNNAIVRSYLGKAYFEEKRSPLDTEQFDMAKGLDPNDPTPWFYGAIAKQSENRPAEALEDLQKSIDLNDNRAVYRSSFQLDQDEAARSASQARIYSNLGFEQLAQQQAYHSINRDFANHSAHRFLAEAYAQRPRHEIARVSELLQAQLLAPININPVAPHLSETQLGIQPNAGPSGATFNEYDPLFERNQSRWQISALVGNHQTNGDEVVYSELVDNSSISLGQYHYETDGFRPNNTYRQNISNLFTQSAITPNQSIQFEFKHSEKENGDLRLRFDPNDYSAVRKETRDEETYRLGYHLKVTPQSHFLASLIYQNSVFTRDESEEVSPVGPFGPIIAVDILDQDFNSRTAEAQYILNNSFYDIILGTGNYRVATNETSTLELTSGGIVLAGGPATSSFTTTGKTTYIYSHIKPFNNLALTFGLSKDDISNTSISELNSEQTNPKLGIQWDLSSNTRIRLAGFRTLKRNRITNQTIEPTQVAGFNQFFDEPTATDAKNYGLAYDQKISSSTYTGIELTQRNLEIPISGNYSFKESQTEYSHRAYFYTSLGTSYSFSAEYEYSDYSREISSLSTLTEPRRLITRKLPLSLTFHQSTGFGARLTASHYNQDVSNNISLTETTHNEDEFWIFDGSLSYRLDKRYGLISLEIRNLTDETFQSQETTFRTGDTQPSNLYHDRSYWLRFTLTL